MSRYSQILIGILFLKVLFLGWYITQGYIGLGPDEAQYWTWSRQLDWGYYSKPPGIALQIALGTRLLGDTELGVRFGSLLFGAIIPFVIYRIALSGGLSYVIAFWAALGFAFSPLGMMSSLLSITDVGMALAWVLASWWIFRSLKVKDKADYLIPGIFIAAGALFKWPIYFFWLVVLLGMFFIRSLRSHTFWVGFFVSLLGLVPVLIWNIQYDWVTFRHVGVTMMGGHGAEMGTTALLKGNVLEFIGAQILLVSPILFVLMVYGWYCVCKKWKEELPVLIKWGVLSSLALFGGFAIVAFFEKMQGNWCDFAYLLAFPLIAWVSLRWTRMGTMLSLALVVLVLALPVLVQEYGLPFGIRLNPFKHNMGWNKIASILVNEGYHPGNNFLFGETYQATSLLNFYGPDQKKAYFLNLEGARHNQFDIWPGMAEEQQGKTGYFVQVLYPKDHKNKTTSDTSNSNKNNELRCDNNKMEHLEKYFKSVECLGIFPLLANESKFIRLWRCQEYNGLIPKKNNKY